jgi:hypothetical protein
LLARHLRAASNSRTGTEFSSALRLRRIRRLAQTAPLALLTDRPRATLTTAVMERGCAPALVRQGSRLAAAASSSVAFGIHVCYTERIFYLVGMTMRRNGLAQPVRTVTGSVH